MLTLLILTIVLAFVFDLINGFHDAANSIATVVSTKVLAPLPAVLWAAFFNFVAYWVFDLKVANTVAKTVDGSIINLQVILAGVIAAIIWNLLTWYFGIPSSSSHALIGGLVGATISKAGKEAIHVNGLLDKVIIPMFTSPLIGLMVGFLIMLGLLWIFYRHSPQKMHLYFRKAQLVSSAFMAFSHGSNDAQKTMGIITLALLSYGSISVMEIPFWVIFLCALFMGLGTMAGGWKIIRTMGSKVIKLKPVHGFAAETSAALVIFIASHLGIPLSTTHVISTSIIGVGLTQRASAMKWGLVGRIVQTWIFTIPACGALAWIIFKLFA